MQRKHKVGLAAAVGVMVLVGAGVGVATATSAATNAACAVPTAPVFQVVNPTSQVSLVTVSRSEADGARSSYGFTVDNGVVFHAPTAAATGLNAVVRLYHPGSGDFFWTASATEATRAVDTYGYQRQKTDFYAAPAALGCTVPVYRLVKGQLHRLAVESAVGPLTSTGWTNEGVKFHGFPAPSATTPAPVATTADPTATATTPPATPPTTTVPTSPTTPPTRPLDSVLSSGVLGDATYTFSDFGISKDGQQVGALLPLAGLTGTGENTSIVQINPNSSTRAALVPVNDPAHTNPIDLIMVCGTAGSMAAPTLSGFTLRGTPQGHLYNGLRLSYTRGARISHVKVVAIPGNYHINPGETFGINDWQGHGNTYDHIEVDGAGVGASALGINSSDNVTITAAYVHDNPYSAGIAVWQTTNVTLTDVRTVANRTGLNLERVQGTVLITRPTWQGNTEQDLYIGSDYGSAKYTITDPVLAPGARLRIRLPVNEMGKPNLQLKSDIKVLVNGADVTASLVQWL